MRFTTWNAFIVSTFALLSLVTPVANAVDLNWVARIVQPSGKPGVSAQSYQTVVWYVVKKQNPSSVCHRRRALLQGRRQHPDLKSKWRFLQHNANAQRA